MPCAHIRPQLEPQAILHLCKTLSVGAIFVDQRHKSRTETIKESLRVLDIPTYNMDTAKDDLQDPEMHHELSSIAYYAHTSGTSSGLPKPISQSHHGIVSALPSLPGKGKPATFSTTPLYHGGFADCFRAWTSGAMIWLFPEGVAPITGTNLISALKFARDNSSANIKYFSSVPYVLQMLAEMDEGVQLLRTMDLVGVGGAALPPTIGDKLVKADVKLVSRMGSAECGFLMSSQRNYENDKEWQYLRAINDPQLLVFEPQSEGLSELVVKPKWPVIAKTNRADGSYATADLFEPHKSIPNAWRYHSRADAQITLANGKKFDPAPIEADILASTNVLQGVLIFGSGKEYPGILLFPTSEKFVKENIIEAVWPWIDRMNRESQSHTRLTRSMMIVVAVKQGETPLEKSSKGTILRRQAEQRYAHQIKSAYKEETSMPPDYELVSDEHLESKVKQCFSEITGRDVDPDQDLFQQGVDSMACVQIRKLVELTCLPTDKRQLPLNVVYDHGTISSLVSYLRHVRSGTQLLDGHEAHQQLDLMKKLAEKYSDFQRSLPTAHKKQGRVVILTGATGFLGTHILHYLRDDMATSKIYCLLRAQTAFAAHERVSKALINRGMASLERFDNESINSDRKVVCLPCNLSSQDLGLSSDDRERLVEEAAVLIHSAWAVNFNIRLSSFEDQVAGTRNLIDLCIESGARFTFISSIAAVSGSVSATVPEKISHDAVEASPLGYSQSKWVAERICATAHRRLAEAGSSVSTPITVIRVGQLCGNNQGIWNTSEAYPLMLSTASLTGSLPALADEVLDWIPVEAAARAVLQIVFRDQDGHARGVLNEESLEPPIFHVLNPHRTPSWKEMLHWISEEFGSSAFEAIPPSEWIAQLEGVLKERKSNHPSQALLGLWKGAYGQDQGTREQPAKSKVFDVALARQASETMRTLEPLDRERIARIWTWVRQNIKKV